MLLLGVRLTSEKAIKRKFRCRSSTPLDPAEFCFQTYHLPQCLCNSITHQAIVVENCSNPQTTWRIFQFIMKKKFYVLGFTFFVGDVIKWGKFLAILAQVTWA